MMVSLLELKKKKMIYFELKIYL